MKEPNIHFHSESHRNRVIKMNDAYEKEQALKIIKACGVIILLIFLAALEVIAIGMFA